MDRTLSLEDVARLVDQPVDELRLWCATGLLACEREDGRWALPVAELPAAHSLAVVGPRLAATALPDGARLLAVAFADHRAARAALDRIRARTGVRPADVEVAPMSIDGMARVLIAGRIPAEHESAIRSLAVESGGHLIDGLPAAAPANVDDRSGATTVRDARPTGDTHRPARLGA